MKRVYIWGAGYYADHIYSVIDRTSCTVNGMVDSSPDKQGKCWKGKIRIHAPEELAGLDFEYIIVSVLKYEEVERKCRELGIPEEKIVPYWKDRESCGLFESRALRVIKEQREKAVYKNRLESAPYEWGLKAVPHIEPAESLLKKIGEYKSSLCRFGDGEFEIMRGLDRPWYQKKSESLRDRLAGIISSDIPGINIAIPQNFTGLDQYKEGDADSIREYMSNGTREDILKFLDLGRVYYDAYVARPYIIYKDAAHAGRVFRLFKEIWQGRDVIIVEGRYARCGIHNDLFSGAGSVRRVICPPREAWGHYGEILDSVLCHARKDDLVCISLGPAATVLAYDIAGLGIQALDIGQLDNEYDWYRSGVTQRAAICGKMVAEVDAQKDLEGFYSKEYLMQIVAEIA